MDYSFDDWYQLLCRELKKLKVPFPKAEDVKEDYDLERKYWEVAEDLYAEYF